MNNSTTNTFLPLSHNQPLVNNRYLLEKFSGKGGWTYAQIAEILPGKPPFGWVRVRGTIDDYAINNYHLMPMGKGKMFLPIKADIRKKIKKQAGDYVMVTLFADDLPTETPEEFKLCLLDEPCAFDKFVSMSNGQQRAVLEWIYSAKTEVTKIERMALFINKIARQQLITRQNNDPSLHK